MNDAFRELRFAVRSLRKRPGFSLLVVATLALGIGATAAIFSVVNAVLLRPLPYPDAERLVMVWGTDEQRDESETRVSYPDFRDWREGSSSFEDLAAFWALLNTDVNLTGGVEPERVPVARVTAGYFDVLGVLALLFGRLLAASLFGVGPADPRTYVATVAILVSSAVLSAYVPARRAAAVDPTVALRSD